MNTLTKPHVLLVENDQSLAWSIQQSLIKNNFQCCRCRSLEESYLHLESKNFDVVILDRVLDDGDSLEIIKYLSELNSPTRSILISQLGETDQKILGLKSGADDYLSKPFSPVELLLRVEKLAKMRKFRSDQSICVGNITILPYQGKAVIKDRTIKLRKREMQILQVLALSQGKVVSRQSIVNHVWGLAGFIPSLVTLDVYIRRIRVKLGEHKDRLKTVRGFGYQLTQ